MGKTDSHALVPAFLAGIGLGLAALLMILVGLHCTLWVTGPLLILVVGLFLAALWLVMRRPPDRPRLSEGDKAILRIADEERPRRPFRPDGD